MRPEERVCSCPLTLSNHVYLCRGRALHKVRQQRFVERQPVAVAVGQHARLEAHANVVAPRHERGARRRARALHVKGREAHAGGGERVDVRRCDERAGQAQVRAAKVVDNDEDDVLWRASGGRGGGGGGGGGGGRNGRLKKQREQRKRTAHHLCFCLRVPPCLFEARAAPLQKGASWGG
jgi:hypothetical protein